MVQWAHWRNIARAVPVGSPCDQLTGLFHAGGWDGSLSDMELQSDLNLGYFLWYNQGGDEHRSLRAEFNAAFAERFFAGCP